MDIQTGLNLLSSLLMVLTLCLHPLIALQGSGIWPQESVKQCSKDIQTGSILLSSLLMACIFQGSAIQPQENVRQTLKNTSLFYRSLRTNKCLLYHFLQVFFLLILMVDGFMFCHVHLSWRHIVILYITAKTSKKFGFHLLTTIQVQLLTISLKYVLDMQLERC